MNSVISMFDPVSGVRLGHAVNYMDGKTLLAKWLHAAGTRYGPFQYDPFTGFSVTYDSPLYKFENLKEYSRMIYKLYEEQWSALELLDAPIGVGTSSEGETSATNVNYYLCPVNNPNRAKAPYVAECSDIQEALGMTHAEGEVFAALWRKCAARTLGAKKAGNSSLRDSEKCLHYSKRMVSVETGTKVE